MDTQKVKVPGAKRVMTSWVPLFLTRIHEETAIPLMLEVEKRNSERLGGLSRAPQLGSRVQWSNLGLPAPAPILSSADSAPWRRQQGGTRTGADEGIPGAAFSWSNWEQYLLELIVWFSRRYSE